MQDTQTLQSSSSIDCVSVAATAAACRLKGMWSARLVAQKPYVDLCHRPAKFWDPVQSMCTCRTLLAREHQRVRGEYEERLRELERERQGAEEDKAQVCLQDIACCASVLLLHAAFEATAWMLRSGWSHPAVSLGRQAQVHGLGPDVVSMGEGKAEDL